MNAARYMLILSLAFSVAACGVRRDLKMPEPEKAPKEQVEQTAPAEPAEIVKPTE